jgi:LacI family transcriptional regulator
VGEHLVSLGHTRFGFVQGPVSHRAASARRGGFLSALAAHGLEPPMEAYGGFDFETSIMAGKQLMQVADHPTAIFASNDDSAAGVMAALAQLGVKVPDQVSIVGFDDSWIARSVWPNLTTIYQPIAEMAETAVNLLLDRTGAMERAGTVMMDYHLVARNSTTRSPAP